MPPELRLHPDAIAEAQAAREWYEHRNPIAAESFMQEFDHAIQSINQFPDRWSPYSHGTRRFLLRRFPFFVVYQSGDGVIEVLAVAHGSRRPEYWKTRT